MQPFNLIYTPNFYGYKPEAVCYRTSCNKEDIRDYTKHCYDDLGAWQHSPIRLLHERILLGDSFPLTVILNRLDSLDRVFAVLLMSNPSLALYPATLTWVNALDLEHRLGLTGYSALPSWLRGLWEEWQALLPDPSDSTANQLEALQVLLSVIEEELSVGAPMLGLPEDLNVLDRRGAFLYYRSPKVNFTGVYGAGFLGGLWDSGSGEILIYKKSPLVKGLNLEVLQRRLELQNSSGKPWSLDKEGLTLANPAGTEIDSALVWSLLENLI